MSVHLQEGLFELCSKRISKDGEFKIQKSGQNIDEMDWGLAVDCDICDGYHYNELDVFAKIYDPETGELLSDGQVGEVVLTSIARDAMPIIRFFSHP